MFSSKLVLVGGITFVLAVGCDQPSGPVADGLDIPKVEARIRNSAKLSMVSANEAIDVNGRAWTLVGDVHFTDATRDDRAAFGEAPLEAPPVRDLSAEELAEKIRPVRIQDGRQYTLRDAPLDVAREILQMKAEGKLPPPSTSNEGTGGPVAELQTSSDLRPKWVISGTSNLGVPGSYDDSRYNYTPTSSYPARATGKWENVFCTGFFIGPRTIVTAAHCFYDRATGTWGSVGRFIPGKNDSYEPWGKWPISTFYIPSAYISETAENAKDYDFGVADLLIDPGYTGSPGWHGMDAYAGTNNSMAINGYPLDLPLFGTKGFEQFRGYSGSITSATGWARWKHNVDMYSGDSGGCMSHTYGSDSYSCVGVNVAQYYSGSTYWNETRAYDTYMWTFIRDYTNAW